MLWRYMAVDYNIEAKKLRERYKELFTSIAIDLYKQSGLVPDSDKIHAAYSAHSKQAYTDAIPFTEQVRYFLFMQEDRLINPFDTE